MADTSYMGLCAYHHPTALHLVKCFHVMIVTRKRVATLQSCLNIMLCNDKHISRCFKETGGERQMLHLEAMPCMGDQVCSSCF